MKRRNWLDLPRKLIDRYDLDYSFNAVEASLAEYASSFWGEGVLKTALYPNPFPITLSGSVLGGSVGSGIAYNINGQIVRIDPLSTTAKTFTIDAADSTFPRWDLLVIRRVVGGETLIPKPEDPLSTVYLNFFDDFAIVVIKGSASSAPSYPAKAATDVILAGIRVPASSTLGTECFLDLGVRENALQAVYQNPTVVYEAPSIVSPSEATLSKKPLSSQAILLFKDGGAPLTAEQFILTDSTIQLIDELQPGQTLSAWFIADDPTTLNPLTLSQEVAVNAGDSQTFFIDGQPLNKSSLMVWAGESLLLPNDFQLVLGPISQIQLNSAISPGQKVQVAYFGNPYQIGSSAPSGGGGGVSGAENLGTGVGLFSGLVGSALSFLSLKDGVNTSVANNGDGTVSINVSGLPGGGAGIVAHGSDTSPNSIDPSVGLSVTADLDQVFIVSPAASSGAVPIVAVKQIADGLSVGQRVTLIGLSGADYYQFSDGRNLSLNGPVSLKDQQVLALMWTGSVWREVSRTI